MANEQSFKDKIIKVFNMDVDNEYEEEYEEDYEETPFDDEEVDQEEREYERRPAAKGALSSLAGRPEVLVLEPEFFEDAPMIVNKIKDNKTVVVNLKNTEYEDGRKIFDFLNGAVFALEGSINKIAVNVFILAPKAVSVSKDVEKEPGEMITPILDWDAE